MNVVGFLFNLYDEYCCDLVCLFNTWMVMGVAWWSGGGVNHRWFMGFKVSIHLGGMDEQFGFGFFFFFFCD